MIKFVIGLASIIVILLLVNVLTKEKSQRITKHIIKYDIEKRETGIEIPIKTVETVVLKENNIYSDELIVNQNLPIESVLNDSYNGKIPGKDLQDVSVESITDDPTLTEEEKENSIADKAYYNLVAYQIPIVKIDSDTMRKMIDEDEHLNLNK